MKRLSTSMILGLILGMMLVALSNFSNFVQVVSAQGVTVVMSPVVRMLNQADESITSLTDGDLIHFTVEVTEAVSEPVYYSIYLDDAAQEVGTCRIPSGGSMCLSESVETFGWYWQDGEVAPSHEILVAETGVDDVSQMSSLAFTVKPRPVVMVHGFGSDYTTWLEYLGPSGFLARAGLQGFAVGDGQVEGKMQTGSLLNPSARTNTIATNAAALAEYLANVKELTGAEQVDLLVHSMGGLISRYYIDRLMEESNVAQLIMLGTPNGGSNCAVMVGSLGFYEPAGLELREDYVRNVFNPQIVNQKGIPFYNFAGTPIQERLFSPCSKVPNDLVVSLESASSAPVTLQQVPYLHIDLTISEELFTQYVLPLLRKSPEDFSQPGTQSTPRVISNSDPVQYSQVYTGVVTSPEGNSHTINIDNEVAVASFGLYDPSRTLTVTVRGASGNVITLTPTANGLTVIDDPESLLYLGYGFTNPRPGPWQVTVQTTALTPPLGTEYAIVAQYVGGAAIDAALSNHLPGLGEQVVLSATLRIGDEALVLDGAQVLLTRPDGSSETLPIVENGAGIAASFAPDAVGVYGVDLNLRAILPDGTVAERSTYLALEAFEEAPEVLRQ